MGHEEPEGSSEHPAGTSVGVEPASGLKAARACRTILCAVDSVFLPDGLRPAIGYNMFLAICSSCQACGMRFNAPFAPTKF